MRNKKTIKEFRAFYVMASSVYAKSSRKRKMWGNGIALPNALYVMQGIAEVVGVHHSK